MTTIEPAVVSPRIAQLIEDAAGDSSGATARFWEELAQGGTPMVEPDPDDADWRLVTFVWRDSGPVDHVLHVEHWSGGNLRDQLLERLAGTDVWYRTMRLPATFRSEYSFGPNDPLNPFADGPNLAERAAAWRRDPLNPHRVLEGFDEIPAELAFFDTSVLALPDAEPMPWFDPGDDVPAGDLTRHRVASALLGNERDIWLYLPATAVAGPLPLIVHFDGEMAIHAMRLPRTLDALIHTDAIPPVAALLIGNVDRNGELPPNDRFVGFLADELLPWARSQDGLTLSDEPADIVIAGQSYGGLAASYAALTRPEVFGNVISESASYWWLPDPAAAMAEKRIGAPPAWEWLPAHVASRPVAPVHWSIDVGILESRVAPPGGPSLLAGVRHMRDVLTAQGAEIVRYHEFMGGHNTACWRGMIADGLVALLGDRADATNRSPVADPG